MNLLRDIAIRQIIAGLDRSVFTKHAFDASFNNEKEGELVRIVFRDKPECYFVIKEVDSIEPFRTIESPGLVFKAEEEHNAKDYAVCLPRIDKWLGRVLEECVVTEKSTVPIFQHMRENLYKNSEELPEPDKPFDEEEALLWRSKLDGLVQQFEELSKQKKIQEHELALLKKDVKDLKDKIGSMSKRTWVRATGNKVLSALERLSNSEAAKTLAQGSVKLLLGVGGD